MNNEKRWEDIFEKALEGNKVTEVNSFEEAMRLNSLIELTDQSRTLPHTNFPEQRRQILAASLKQQLKNSAAIQIVKAAPVIPVVAPKIQVKPLQRAPETRQRMGWRLFVGFQQAFVVVFLFITVGVVVYAATRPETPVLPTTIPAAATRPPEEATPTPPPVATATPEIVPVTTLVVPVPVETPEPTIATIEPSPTSQPTPSPTTAASTATATKTAAPVVVVRTTPKPAPTATKKPEPTNSPTPVRTTEVEATATAVPTATATATATATNTVPATPVPPTQPPAPTVKPTPTPTPTEDDGKEPPEHR